MRTISIKMTLANRTISLKYFVTFLFILPEPQVFYQVCYMCAHFYYLIFEKMTHVNFLDECTFKFNSYLPCIQFLSS